MAQNIFTNEDDLKMNDYLNVEKVKGGGGGGGDTPINGSKSKFIVYLD